MEKEKQEKELTEWYFRPLAIVLAMVFFGPLGLILVWFRPRTPVFLKIAVTLAVLAATYWASVKSVEYYQSMAAYIEDLSGTAGGS
jgi:hypothetical protein